MLRRSFLATAAAAPAALAIDPPAQTAIPRWRGFNLLDYFQALPRDGGSPKPTPEDLDRKSVVEGKTVDVGGGRMI